MRSSPLRSEWRLPAAALLCEIAAVHATLVPRHLHEAPYAGALFIAISAASVLLAGVLLRVGHPVVWGAAAVLAASAICGYVISRSLGLPMMSDDIGDWLNPLGVGAVCAETITLFICAGELCEARRAGQGSRASRVTPLATGSA